MDLKQIKELSFEQILDLIEQGVLSEPRVVRLYLDTAKSNEFYSVAGNYFYAVDASSSSANFQAKFNRLDSDKIKFEKGFGLRRPFKQFWITSSAQAGEWVDILIGTISPELLEVIDNRTAIAQQQVLEAIRDELRGIATPGTFDDVAVGVAAVSVIAANAARKGCVVQAKKSNTGLIYIGFANTVASTKALAELQAGMSIYFDDYRGDIFAISDAAAQVVYFGEW